MGYEAVPQGQTVVQQSRSRISKWWPISFFIVFIVFIIIGGGLIGAWVSSSSTYSYSYYSSYSYYGNSANDGLFYGGVACFAIAGICKLVAWILLIVFCVQGRRSQTTTVSYVTQPVNYAPPPQQGYYSGVPMQPASPAPVYPNKEAAGLRYCGQCGSAVTTQFCPQCGRGV